jgi:1A family penicillin-binding protein
MKLLHPRRWRLAEWVVASLIAAAAVTGSVAVWWIAKYAAAVHRLHTGGVGDTTFTWADGTPWFRMDEQRHDVPLDEIAVDLRNAVVAVEDHRFRRHVGIDPLGVARAAWTNVSSDDRQGASTITQQLARALFLSNQRTWSRKAKEAALAIILEQQLTKDQILELYLNRVYLSAGVYGVEPLSRRLFGRPSSTLSLPEAALIAGLIRAPSALSPWANLDGAMERARVVLQRMREEGYITEAQQREAARARVRIRPYSVALDGRAGYAKEFVRQQFRDSFGGDRPPDWLARTTFLPPVQDAAERAVEAAMRRFGRKDLQVALVALESGSGDVVAMVGGRDYIESPFNRAVRARRQPGSTFKPFVAAAALASGWSPVSRITGLQSIGIPDRETGEEWSPRNVGGEDADALTLRQALLASNNRAAVALQQQVGSRAVRRIAWDAGLGEQPDVPSLALGTGLVSPLDLARGYATLASGGWRLGARGLIQVVDGDGDVVLDVPARRDRVLSPEVAFQVTSMLADVVDRGTGSLIRSYGVAFPVAGKTGTTNDFKDAWFAGYSSSLVAVVWVGHDQPAPMGRDWYGARVAGPIWADFMRRAARAYPPRPFTPPPGLRTEPLCRVSYLKPVSGCPTYVEYFKEGDVSPARLCPAHEGDFGQQVRRATEGVLGWLIGRILGRKGAP